MLAIAKLLSIKVELIHTPATRMPSCPTSRPGQDDLKPFDLFSSQSVNPVYICISPISCASFSFVNYSLISFAHFATGWWFLQLTFERSLSINCVSLCDELQLFFPPTCFSFIFVLGIFLPCKYLLCLCGPTHQGFHSWFLGFVFVEGILSRDK